MAIDGVESDGAAQAAHAALEVKAGEDLTALYSYGQTAYRSDPNAKYGFAPEIVRVLPVDKRSRWR